MHSEQHHTIDVLIIRFFSIVFWFNPFIWLYQKALLQNLEFIADSEATKRLDDKKAYQMALLKITTHENCIALTNHFYQSLIKKRIVMLNKNQSKKWNSWKYVLVLPALVAFVLLFQIKVLAQEKTMLNSSSKSETEDIILVINKNTTDEKLKQETLLLKDVHGINLKVSKVKRNAKQEITGIKVQFDDKNGNKGINQVDSDQPIAPITFVKSTDKNGKSSIGFYTGKPNSRGKINKKIVVNTSDDKESNFTFSFSDDEDALTPPDAPDAANQPKVQIEKRVIVAKSANGEKPIVYINGKKVAIEMEELSSKMDPSTIERMDVFKGDVSIEKYGEEGKNGVIVITTKDGKTEVNVDKIVKRAQADVERTLNERENMQSEMERARKEMELSKIEIQKAKAEIEKAKQEIIKAKKEIENAKTETQKKQKI